MGTRIPLDPEEIKRRQLQEKLKLSCAEIGLSVRTTNCLDEQGITTVADLLQRKRADLLSIPNFGEKTRGKGQEELIAARCGAHT